MKERSQDILSSIFYAAVWIALIGGFIWVLNQSDNADSSTNETSAETSEAAPKPDPNGYSTCSDAHDEGVYNIPEDSPAYKNRQDADQDGYACEPYYGR